jgi:16S rRNA (adenine1518-N6/adenine1519-N6)-dimethyltransferase
VSQTKRQIQELLQQAGSEPRQRFGQNFMIDQNLVRLVADAGMIRPDDAVIEVGPGTGTLTEELLQRAGKVVAVEIDRDLARLLRERFGANPKFELIEGDALAGKHALNPELVRVIPSVLGRDLRGQRDSRVPHEIPRFARDDSGARAGIVKLVANLPYNIASPLVIESLIAGMSLLAFTVQKEVADRLKATANDDAYGPLSVMANMLSRVEILRTLPPQAFWPAPKIDSALVRMTREDRLGPRAADFSRFVHQVFGFRRKTLRKALDQAGYDPKLLEALHIQPQLRPENLTPEQFLQMFESAKPKAS